LRVVIFIPMDGRWEPALMKMGDGLLLDGYKHYRIFHSENEFARGKSHVNGIESFCSYTKRRLAKFNDLQKSYF